MLSSLLHIENICCVSTGQFFLIQIKKSHRTEHPTFVFVFNRCLRLLFWGFAGARRCSVWYKSLSLRWSQRCQQTFAQTTAAVCYLINTTESVHIYPLPCETRSQWLLWGSTLMSLWFTLTGLAVGVQMIWGHGGGVLRGNQRLTVGRSPHAANSHWLPPATQTQAHSDSWSTCITCIRRQLPLRL